MTRTELIDDLANRTGVEKKEVKSFLEHLTTLIEDEIKKGGEVPLKGLGKFRVQHRKARIGRNPLTGDEISLLDKGIIDSVGVMELVAYLESDHGLTIEDADLVPDNLDSVANLVGFVERKQAVA